MEFVTRVLSLKYNKYVIRKNTVYFSRLTKSLKTTLSGMLS